MPNLRRILIPTDFSKNAAVTFGYGNALGKAIGAVIDLVHVIQGMSYMEVNQEFLGNSLEMKDSFQAMEKQVRQRLQKELEDNFDKDQRGAVFINTEMHASRGILDEVEKRKYEMILIGSRGRGNAIFNRGSVTQQLIQQAPIPILSFNNAFDAALETILVPTDGSPLSLMALPFALDMASFYQAKITLYNVIETDFYHIGFATGIKDMYKTVHRALKKDLLEELRNFFQGRGDYKYSGGVSEDTVLIEGTDGSKTEIKMVFENKLSAHRSIVEYANENAQLVAMTTNGRSGFSKLLIGSVAEKVVRHLEVPAYTLKPTKNEIGE